MASEFSLLGEVLVIGSLFLLAVGYFASAKDHSLFGIRFPLKIGYKLNIIGWLCLGFFWWVQVEHYILIKDPVNAFLCAAAVPFFGYLAYHEYLSLLWNKEYEPLRWLAAMTVVAGGIYFFVERVPYLSGWLIQVVAEQSIWILNVLDIQTTLGNLDYGGGSRWYRPGSDPDDVRISIEAETWKNIDAPAVNIVLACTALQSMIIFVGGVICTKAPSDRRLYAFLATVPPIYILNLIRNAVVIWLTYEHIWGVDTFFWAHAVLGKIGSLIALIFLAIAVFHFLPEMQDSILGVLDLPLREPPKDAPDLPFAKGMPIGVVYAGVIGLTLFPFGFFADSSAIAEAKGRGFDSGMPLEEMYILSIILIILTTFLLFFYRDPYREIQEGVVSPADGLVQIVKNKRGRISISVFMNLQNVHVNRSPFNGTILSQKHKSGGYLPAFSKDSHRNERLVTKLDTDIGVMKVTQIAGILVRRIVSYVKPESFVRKGDRIGLIHFGSRVDINFDSAGMELKVKEGDKILAGQTLSTFTPMSSLPVSKQILEGPKRLLSKLASSSIGGD